MIDTLAQIDTELFIFFNDCYRHSFLDNFLSLFTDRLTWIPMYAAILLMFVRIKHWGFALLLLLALIIAVSLTDSGCAKLIRPFVERLRPSNLDNPISAITQIVDGKRGGAYGFPSCHAANSFCLAVFTSLIVIRKAFITFIFVWAVFNSYTRLYLGVHYPGDLLVGALIGSVIACLCYVGAIAIIKRINNNTKPQLVEQPFICKVGLHNLTLQPNYIVMFVGALTLLYIIVYSIVVA